jgi:hypothetical protein
MILLVIVRTTLSLRGLKQNIIKLKIKTVIPHGKS